MRREDLNVGDRVWVYLSGSAGKGYAEVQSFQDRGAWVQFDPGSSLHNGGKPRFVSMRSIIRPEIPSTLPGTVRS